MRTVIIDGWGLDRASLQAGLLPTRPGSPAALPGNWAEEFHSASSLRVPDLTPVHPSGAAAGCTRRQLATLLSSAAQPGADIVVLAHDIGDLPSGTYAARPDGGMSPAPGTDVVRFCRTVLAADVVPRAVLALIGDVPGATTARGLRTYRHALIAAGRFGLGVEQAAVAAGLRASVRADFVDDAANRHLGLHGTGRACMLVVELD